MSNPFEISTQLNTSTVDHWDDIGESTYKGLSFMIDRSMSYHLDTVMLANEVTGRFNMPSRWKYDFYRYAIQPKKKRFAKWSKMEADADLDLIMSAYNVNRRKAIQIQSLINKDDMNIIRETMNYGGK